MIFNIDILITELELQYSLLQTIPHNWPSSDAFFLFIFIFLV